MPAEPRRVREPGQGVGGYIDTSEEESRGAKTVACYVCPSFFIYSFLSSKLRCICLWYVVLVLSWLRVLLKDWHVPVFRAKRAKS